MGERQLDFHLQAAAGHVGGVDRATVRIDRALRDREAEAEAGGALAGGAAVEGIEHFLELARRDARAVVADREYRGGARGMDAHVDRGARPRELHGVSYD